MKSTLTKERQYQVKCLEVGQIVRVSHDHKELGRIACEGTIVDLRGPTKRLALVNLTGPVQGFFQMNVLIPKRDIFWLELF